MNGFLDMTENKGEGMETEQEKFWQGEFGEKYIKRNIDSKLLSSNISFFSKIFSDIGSVKSVLELGCNAGMNLKAIEALNKEVELTGVDINELALSEVDKWGGAKTIVSSIINLEIKETYDLTFTKGVMIHINPKLLTVVYENLYKLSTKYILIAEYYNATPVSIDYHGHSDKLFKRDFAGDMLDKYSDLTLVDHGFLYHRDPVFPQDDITWFLLKK